MDDGHGRSGFQTSLFPSRVFTDPGWTEFPLRLSYGGFGCDLLTGIEHGAPSVPFPGWGHAVEIRVDDVYKCRDTWRVLQPVIGSLYEEGRLEAGNAVGSAREAITKAEGLGDLPVPLDQLSIAMEVAGAAAEAIGEATKVAELADADVVTIAADAFAAGTQATTA